MRRAALLMMLFAAMAEASMNDSSAILKAKSIWGPNSYIARARLFGDPNWTMKVGCIDSSNHRFIVAGKALGSWDDAFAAVDMGGNGPHTLTAVATDVAGNSATSTPVLVYACNPMPLVFVTAALPDAAVGMTYDAPLKADGGYDYYVFSVAQGSTLPAGMMLQANHLVGFPAATGQYQFTLQVSDGTLTATQALTLNVVAP